MEKEATTRYARGVKVTVCVPPEFFALWMKEGDAKPQCTLQCLYMMIMRNEELDRQLATATFQLERERMKRDETEGNHAAKCASTIW